MIGSNKSNNNGVRVEVDGSYNGVNEEGAIYIYDAEGEVIMWDIAEWRTDPALVLLITSLINEALTVGTINLRIRTGHVPGYDGQPVPDKTFDHWRKRLEDLPESTRATLPRYVRDLYGFVNNSEDSDSPWKTATEDEYSEFYD